MSRIIASRDAGALLPSRLLSCSDKAKWRSLLVRRYADPPTADPFATAATPDLLVVLNTRGVCRIGSRRGTRWHEARYRPGIIGITAPERSAVLRLHTESDEPIESLHVHIPSELLARIVDEHWEVDAPRFEMPDALFVDDPLLAYICIALQGAIEAGWGELYAASAAQFMATHILTRHGGLSSASLDAMAKHRLDDRRLRRVIEYMRDHLADAVTLETLSEQAAMSRFHFVRLFKNATGMTPHAFLVRLRMKHAQLQLGTSEDPVGEIAVACGYESPTHFAAAFRRHVGVSPSKYRSFRKR
jgi:AraC family transcriptional regulator